MADVEDFFIFRGNSDQEAEDFVRAVRIQAFKSGKHNDPKWTCAFAATALAGKALRWYLRLPTSTQQDWLTFQDAILEHRWGDSAAVTSNLVPTTEPVPAAAPPPGPHSSYRLITSVPHLQTQRIGRIRIIADTPIDGYLGKTYSAENGLTIVSDRTSAAQIVYDSSEFPCALKSSDFAPPFTFLGGQHLDTSEKFSKFGPGATGSLRVRPCCDPSDRNSRINFQDGLKGDLFINIWIVCEDRSLFAVAPQAGCIYKLTPIALKHANSIVLAVASDPAAVSALVAARQDVTTGVRLYIECEDR